MGMIYQPSGRAREYSDWALNIYQGCEHGCTYCYAPGVLHKTRENFHCNVSVKKNFHERLAQSLGKWKGSRDIQVLLCFTCDPYQPIEKETLATRKTIEMLHEEGMNTCVLTKSPTLAYRDIDLYEPGDAFATTLTFTPEQDKESLKWEPLAELPHQRIMGLEAFYNAGIPTWVSLEPVIDPQSIFEIIRLTHRFTGHYKIGKLNYVKSDVDWAKFARNVKGLLDSAGAEYYMKEDLRAYLDEH